MDFKALKKLDSEVARLTGLFRGDPTQGNLNAMVFAALAFAEAQGNKLTAPSPKVIAKS